MYIAESPQLEDHEPHRNATIVQIMFKVPLILAYVSEAMSDSSDAFIETSANIIFHLHIRLREYFLKFWLKLGNCVCFSYRQIYFRIF